jgi:hypothetical protein
VSCARQARSPTLRPPARDPYAVADRRKTCSPGDAYPYMTPHRARAAVSPSTNPVVEWRRGCLRDAGFPAGLADALAADCCVDLHAVLELTDQGCPPELAARILAPLDDDRRPC